MKIARLLLCLPWCPLVALASPDSAAPPEAYSLHAQATVVSAYHGHFRAPYAGDNSLKDEDEVRNSYTTTLFGALRLWKGAQLVVDPEIAAGAGFGDVTGFAGFPNGEIARVSGQRPKLYRARAYLQQTLALSDATEPVAAEANVLAGVQARERLTFTLGNLSALDLFDDNAYAHDARTQLLNWSLFANGAWDYPADARGYTWGAAAEYATPDFAVRAGRFLMPKVANGKHLNDQFGKFYGDVLEIEHGYTLADHPGRARVLVYRNRAEMGDYRDTLDTTAPGATPDITATRAPRDKKGWGVNVEQQLRADLGTFARLGASDGRNESFAFTEIDRHASLGLDWQGARWGREQDAVEVALAVNGLSHDHRDYLAAGGYGFIVGDGQLRYGTERIAELQYQWHALPHWTLTPDWQHTWNPAYNRDRGPVEVLSLRLHGEI